MTDEDWTSRIAGERMAVDQQFTDRVAASDFSNQQWGLVMTAVEFDIEGADDPETAQLVADTSNLPAIMPELDKVGRGGPMGGGGSDAGGDSGGLLDGVKAVLGLAGGDGEDDRTDEAERLAREYAEELQRELEQNGRWESVCALASGTE